MRPSSKKTKGLEKIRTEKIYLKRYSDDGIQTLGKIAVGMQIFHTLELPWRDNRRRISCIPKGEYRVTKHSSPKFGKSFWVREVPGRSEILIHAGNYYTDILGCILVGTGKMDINGDGNPDVTSSRLAMNKLYDILPDEFNLVIF